MTSSPATPNFDPTPSVIEVGHGAFAYLQPDGGWFINNTGVVVVDDQAVVIDTCATEARTRTFAQAVQDLGVRHIRALVNTHFHGDHTNGNFVFAHSPVIARTGCAARVRESNLARYDGLFQQPDWGDLQIRPPTVEFDGTATLRLDDRVIELHPVPGVAHTDHDVVVHVPDASVLYVGDLVFHGATPLLAFGSIAGSIESLNWLRGFNATVLVPGHGPLAEPPALDMIERYLRFLQDVARTAASNGRNALETYRKLDLDEFSSWGEAERHVGNLHRAMAEVDHPDPQHAEVDLAVIVSDMRAVAGGRITCWA